jgi:aryl carrier-like protein
MRVEWSRWRGLGVTGRVSPRFAHLCGQLGGERDRPAGGTLPGRESILAAGPGDRPGLLAALLRDKMARLLGTSPDRLDGDRPLLQFGIDSLMAVELRNWLESELRVDLPIVALMRSPSISGLAELLAERIEANGQAPHVDTGRNGTPNPSTNGHHVRLPLDPAPTEILARIEDLSGDQVDELLAALLNGDGHGTGW